MLSTIRQILGVEKFTLFIALFLLGLLFVPSIVTAQVPPVEGIKVAPGPFQPLPPGVEIPADVVAQLALDRDDDGFADGMAIVPVRAGLSDVFYITDSNYQAMVILHKDGNGIILIDAPEPLPFPNPAFGLPPYDIITVLEDRFPGVPVTHMLYSHGHTDHIGGASKIKNRWPNVKIIAHKETRKHLAEIKDPKRPVPDVTFNKFRRLRFGNQKIDLHYFGNTHQAGNTYIYLPRQKVLMVVDVIYPGWVPFRRLALSENIRGWLKGHDAVLKFDFRSLVTGHLTIIGDDECIDLSVC